MVLSCPVRLHETFLVDYPSVGHFNDYAVHHYSPTYWMGLPYHRALGYGRVWSRPSAKCDVRG